MRKKVWINQGDTILVGLRDFEDEKADVILKYTPDEARALKKNGALPQNAKIEDNPVGGEEVEETNEGDDVIVDFEDL
jgi:translation initiation factor 1A